MPDVPLLVQYQQGNDVSPAPEGYTQITSPLNPLRSTASRLSHFDEDVYDLSPESHLVRLIKAFLGDSGVGLLQKQMVLVRLQQSLSGTHYFDLDAFYGALFGSGRKTDEILPHDPYGEPLSIEEWDTMQIRDGAYKARVSRLSQAIHLGATARGIKLFAEALSGVKFDLTEDWRFGSYMTHTWDDWQGMSWDDLSDMSWDELERSPAATNERIRNIATLHPSRPLSDGEIFDLEQAIDRLKPANMVVLVSDEIPDVEIIDLPFSPESPSEKWEVRQLVQNTRINGILPYPNEPEDEFISPPLNPWAGYSGEAWTVLDRTPRALAYVTQSDVDNSQIVDSSAQQMAPQALNGSLNGQPVVALPEYAIKPIQGLYSGRSSSDGIVTANPYGERSGTGSYLTVDGLPADFAEQALSTSLRTTDLFWTSPNRLASDGTNDIVELRFDQPVNFNYLSFEFAKFPCQVTAQYWDRSEGRWIDIGSFEQKDSIPYSFPNQPPADAPHPLHYGLGHWEKRSFSLTAVLTQNVRFVFKRVVGNGPVGNITFDTIRELAYPMGLREVDIGFRANSISKVPHVSANAPVATSRNAAGLQTRYFLEVADADRVADDELTAWVSEPQPFADAVVNMYIALGDGTFPEVVNNIYTDPTHTGSVMNIYSTLDIPAGDAASEPRDDVVYPEVNGSVVPVLDGNRGLSLSTSDPAWVDIDTLPLGGTSTGGQFWLGLSWEFQDFPVAPSQGKFTTVSSTALPSGHVNVTHGLEEGTDDYTVYVTVNGVVLKSTWGGYIPSIGQTMRLVVAVGEGFASSLAQISDGDFVVGDQIEADLSLGVSTTFDPRKERHPDDYYETKAEALPLSLDAAQYVGGSDWSGSLVADVDDAYFFGNSNDVTERFIYFPGDVSNYLNVPLAVAQTDLATSESIWGYVRVHPTSWVTGAERFFGGSLGFNLNAGGGFGWGLAADGRLTFEWDTSGTTNQVYSDFRIPRDTSRPVDIVFTLDTTVLRFFYKDTDSLLWNQVGGDIDVTGITIGNPARAFRVGMACPDGGTRAARPFLGAMSSFRLAEGIPGFGADPDQFADAMVIDIQHTDLGVLTPNTTLTTFTSTTGDTVALLADDLTETIVPLTVLSGPCFVHPDLTGTGIRVYDQVADVDFNHRLVATIMASLPFAPALGYAPLLTKKASSSTGDPGWGIYLKSNGSFVVLVSDGTTQVEAEWIDTDGFGPSQPNSCFAIQMLPDAIRLANYQVGASFTSDYVEGNISTLLGMNNTEPVRIFADGTDVTAGIVYSVTAGSEERSSDINNFTRVARSLAEESSFTSIGSSWTVLADGQGATKGSVLFEQSTGVVHPDGDITGNESVLVDSKSAEVRYGSAIGRGAGIKLLGAVVGYGAGPGVDYLDFPDAYNKIPLSNDTTKNLGTFLRYHPDYVGWTSGLAESIGFMGGTPEAWGQAKWTPVGQFVLSKGSYNFPDVLAKAIKLEFTQLTPEPYESFLPIDRTVSRMTQLTDMERGYSQSVQQTAVIEVLTQSRYSETTRPFYDGSDPLLNNVSPTAGSVVIDGSIRDSLGQQFGPMYGLAPWQQSFHSTIQAEAGVHSYDVTRVRSVTRTAFFVGLRTLRVRRIGQRGREDNPYFWETFYDTDNIDVPKTNFEIEPGQLYTPEFNTSSLMPMPRVAVSKPFYTRSPIIGVQFATQQSQSFQVIPDDEFRSNDNKTSTFVDEQAWHRSGDSVIFWDQSYGSVRVSRDPSVLEAYYAPDTPIVHPPVSPVLASGFSRIVTVDEDSFGGIASPSVLIAPRGVVWAAARVAAYNELNADLYLRVYDTTGVLLAQKAFRPKTGFPSEVTMSFISYRAEAYGIEVRVEQDGPYYDSWIMYALSAFDSSVLWEFSNDGGETWVPGYTARNIVNGVVEFPFTGAALLWRSKAYRYNAIIDAIEIRPWYERRIGAPL